MITAGELRAYAKTITVSFSVLVRVHPATVHPTRITESHLQRFLDSLVSLGIVRNVGSECSESCKDLFCFWGFQAGKSPLPAMRPKTQTPEGRPFRGDNYRKAKGTHIRERIAIYICANRDSKNQAKKCIVYGSPLGRSGMFRQTPKLLWRSETLASQTMPQREEAR